MTLHSCPGSWVRLQLPGGLGEAGPQGEEEGQGPGFPGWGAGGRQLWAGIVVDINRAQLGGEDQGLKEEVGTEGQDRGASAEQEGGKPGAGIAEGTWVRIKVTWQS